MSFKELKFNDQSLKATIRLNAVWFDYQDVSRILKSLYSDSEIQRVIAPMSYQAEDESFKVKTTDGEVTVINDSAVFRWIERLNDGDDFNEALDTFRRFISHSAIPMMYRDYYAEPEKDDSQPTSKQTTLTYNGVDIKTICDLQDGAFWFAVADFKKAVEYTAPSTQIVQYTSVDNTKLIETKTNGGPQKLHYINYQGLYDISERCYKQSIKDFVKFLAVWVCAYAKGAEDWKGSAVAVQSNTDDESELSAPQEYDAADEIELLKSEIAELRRMVETTTDLAESTQISVDAILKANPLPATVLMNGADTSPSGLALRYGMPESEFLNWLYKADIGVYSDKKYIKFSYESVLDIYDSLAKYNIYPKY